MRMLMTRMVAVRMRMALSMVMLVAVIMSVIVRVTCQRHLVHSVM